MDIRYITSDWIAGECKSETMTGVYKLPHKDGIGFINRHIARIEKENKELLSERIDLKKQLHKYKTIENSFNANCSLTPMIAKKGIHYVDSIYYTALLKIRDDLNKKIDNQQRTENSLQSEITRLRRELKEYKNPEWKINILKAQCKSYSELCNEKNEKIEELEAKLITVNVVKESYYAAQKMREEENERVEQRIKELKGLANSTTVTIKNPLWYCVENEARVLDLLTIKAILENGKIPKFKTQVTPEQSEYVQKWIFANGGSWLSGDKTILHSEEKYLLHEYHIEFRYNYQKLSFKENKLSEITFAQFKEWAKPIKPEKEYSFSDFPCLTIVEGDGGNKYIAIGDNLSDVPGFVSDKEIFYYNRLQQLCKTDYGQSKVQPSGFFSSSIRVTETTIDKLKVGDWFNVQGCNATDRKQYDHVKEIVDGAIVCNYIDSRGENKIKYYSNNITKVFKFELK